MIPSANPATGGGRSAGRDPAAGLVKRVTDVWRRISAVPDAFEVPGVVVVERAGSRLCPPGWAGVVRLEDSAVVVAPTADAERALRAALHGASAHDVTDPQVLAERLEPLDLMGPAMLGYADAGTADLLLSAGIGQAGLDEAPVDRLLEAAGADDVMESGIAHTTSPLFVLWQGDEVVAAAGYRVWADAFAHLSVLTDPVRRGEGLARRVASAAAAHALGQNLVLQWRARPLDSRAVGRSLGFLEFGAQVSVRLQDSPEAPRE